LNREELEDEYNQVLADMISFRIELVSVARALIDTQTCLLCQVEIVGETVLHQEDCPIGRAIATYRRLLENRKKRME